VKAAGVGKEEGPPAHAAGDVSVAKTVGVEDEGLPAPTSDVGAKVGGVFDRGPLAHASDLAPEAAGAFDRAPPAAAGARTGLGTGVVRAQQGAHIDWASLLKRAFSRTSSRVRVAGDGVSSGRGVRRPRAGQGGRGRSPFLVLCSSWSTDVSPYSREGGAEGR
jgi:hypothetical protein